MRRVLRSAFFMTLVMGFLMTSLVTTADPIVAVDPGTPTVQSTVTFTADLGDDDAISVWITVQECDANTGICFPDSLQNVSMTELADGSYEVSITLIHEDASYLQYTLLVESSEGWNEYLEKTRVDLAEKQNDDGPTNGEDNNSTPGFELILVAIAVLFISLIYFRKRGK